MNMNIWWDSLLLDKEDNNPDPCISPHGAIAEDMAPYREQRI